MSISGISGSDIQLVRQQFQQFRQGKVNLQKSDLENLKAALGASDSQAPTGIDALLSSFGQIDTNQDGISFSELLDYTKTQGHRRTRDLPPVSLDDLNAYKSQLEKDGKTVPPELTELISGFSSIDGDKNAKISFDEVRAYIKQTSPQHAASSMSLSDNLISGFSQADANNDGKIDLEELRKFLKSSTSPTAGDSAQTASQAARFGILQPTVSASLATSAASALSQPPVQLSPLFLRKLAHSYGQRLQATTGGTLQLSA